MAVLDWNEYVEKAVKVNAEGIVMVKNDGGALPVSRDEEIAVFGRIQLNYYKSGTGSGGMVNVSKVTSVIDGLLQEGARLNERVLDTYRKWTAQNPFDLGEGWGGEPWSQKEMPLEEELVRSAAETSAAALVIIGRTAGEEMDNSCQEGSYLLTAGEKDMLRTVRKYFDRVAVLLNVGNIIDMSFVDEFDPAAVLYLWQGGMTGGTGAARVILGDVSPSGRLPDTVAFDISDYPSDKYFYDRDRNFYTEDIYVGYRYFSTFAPERVRYPFGFGLSYTDFAIRPVGVKEGELPSGVLTLTAEAENIGKVSGKEVVQVYCQAPMGKLGKAARVLVGFEKTRTLAPGEKQVLDIEVRYEDLWSYDDSGVTGHPFGMVMEKGVYRLFMGKNVRDAEEVMSFELKEDLIGAQYCQSLAPVKAFERMKAVEGDDGKAKLCFEQVPLSELDEEGRIKSALPEEIPFTGDRGIKLCDVVKGKAALEDFIAQLDLQDLNCLVRGEGMCSPKVTPGTAAAFGGVSERLSELGVPCGCCSDGPSGMRLDVGTKAFSLPNGTLIGATFNKDLVRELFGFMGTEMRANKVDCLLGPGMNIHRHPLNGRNFEYFSEDPFLTGTMAAAELMGLHSAGVEGTVKHFCGNNQETNRHFLDAEVSERALREIYLKGFEIAVKRGGGKSIMTTYGKVNDLWTAGNYGLDTMILREQWGYEGFVMTDWWANISRRGSGPDKNDFAAMVRAQNDVYMVCADGEVNGDNVRAALADGRLTLGELQRSARNILSFLMTTHAMKRLMGEDEDISITDRPEEDIDENPGTEVFVLDGELKVDLSGVRTAPNADYSFTVDVTKMGMYDFTLTASSDAGELAQMPVTVFSLGTPAATFTFNGTGGKPVSFTVKAVPMFSRYTIVRLHFGLGGLDLISLDISLDEKEPMKRSGID